MTYWLNVFKFTTGPGYYAGGMLYSSKAAAKEFGVKQVGYVATVSIDAALLAEAEPLLGVNNNG